MRALTTDEVRRIEKARMRGVMTVAVDLTGERVGSMMRPGADLDLPVAAVEGVPLQEVLHHYGDIVDIFDGVDRLSIDTRDGSIFLAALHGADDHDLSINVTLR